MGTSCFWTDEGEAAPAAVAALQGDRRHPLAACAQDRGVRPLQGSAAKAPLRSAAHRRRDLRALMCRPVFPCGRLMTSKAHLSDEQRLALGRQLQSRLTAMERQSASQLTGLSQAESAHQTLLQDADDATQRAGIHEVEATVSNIESGEFDAVRSALHRLQSADYGLCVDCRATIPFARLKLEPQALRCAACQNLLERASLS